MSVEIKVRECSTVQKHKLNYRFHNPCAVDMTADYILKVFMEVNAGKVEKAIREAVNQCPREPAGREAVHADSYAAILFPKEEVCVGLS